MSPSGKPLSQGLLHWLHDDADHPTSHREKAISAVGGFIGLLLVFWLSHRLLHLHVAALIVGSIGASAVLLFAVPHGRMSQPWPVLGGHLLSAAVGVTCARWIPDTVLAAASALAASIAVMYYLRCLHPPGGATALVAVVGGPQVHSLGYGLVLEPVLVNVAAILAVAVAINFPFPWRRYPLRLSRRQAAPPTVPAEKCVIAHSDLVYALSELDSFVDVSEEELLRIYALAVGTPAAEPRPWGDPAACGTCR